MGTLIKLSHDKFVVRLDEGRTVSLNPKAYPYLSHGYTMTISKAQGKTVERSLVLINSAMEAASTYVALTRHQKECQVYVNQSKFENFRKLVSQISRETPFDFINHTKVQEEATTKQMQRDTLYDRKETLSRTTAKDIPGLLSQPSRSEFLQTLER